MHSTTLPSIPALNAILSCEGVLVILNSNTPSHYGSIIACAISTTSRAKAIMKESYLIAWTHTIEYTAFPHCCSSSHNCTLIGHGAGAATSCSQWRGTSWCTNTHVMNIWCMLYSCAESLIPPRAYWAAEGGKLWMINLFAEQYSQIRCLTQQLTYHFDQWHTNDWILFPKV